MAFESVPGVKVTVRSENRVFVFGDYFAVYDASVNPEIYNWSDVVFIHDKLDEIIIGTIDDRSPEQPYTLPKAAFADTRDYLAARAIWEGQLALNPKVVYKKGLRILPPKTKYKNSDPDESAYVATGAYTEQEINNSNVTLMNTKSFSYVFAILLPVSLAFFILLCTTIKQWAFSEVWYKYLAIAVLSGGIVTMFVYIVRVIFAINIYSRYFKHDPATVEPITFVICEDGFAAVESNVYTFSDIIKWEEATQFVETGYMFIIFRDKNSVTWIPKRLFPAEAQRKISDYITTHLAGLGG